MMIRHLMGVVVCVFISTAAFSQICTDPLTVTIDGSSTGETLDVSCMGTNPICNVGSGDLTGSIDVTVTGGTTDYTYAWSGTAGFVDGIGSQVNLGAGTYTLVVTDANNCTDECMVNLVEPEPVMVSLADTDPACNAASGDPTGEITANPTGGQVTGDPDPAPGDYVYAWTGPAGVTLTSGQTQSNLPAGMYTVTVTYLNECTATASITLDQPDPVAVTGDFENPKCHEDDAPGDGTITLDPPTGGSGSYEFSWTGTNEAAGFTSTSQNLTGLGEGTYTVIVSDVPNGCTDTLEFMLVQPDPMVLTATTEDPTCNNASGDANGTITITGITPSTAPMDYQWTGTGTTSGPGENAQTGLGAGTYTVAITDANGCMIDTMFTLEEPDALAITLDKVDPLCNADNNATQGDDGSITSVVTNGQGTLTYEWTKDGAPFAQTTADISGLEPGNYVVVVTDSPAGCSATANIMIDEPSEIMLTLTETPLTCASGTGDPSGGITTTVSGGTVPGTIQSDYTFSWTGPGGFASILQNPTDLVAGTYNVTVTDGNGCTKEGMVEVTEPQPFTIALDPTDPPCNVDNTDQVEGAISVITTNGVAPFTYAWTGDGTDNNDEDMQTQLGDGAYSVIVTDFTGCTAIANVTLNEPPVIAFFAVATQLSCNIDSYPPGEGADATITIDQVVGGTSVSGNYTYEWTGPAGSNVNPSAQNQTELIAGTYNVTISDDNDCEITGEYVILQPDPVTVSGEVEPLLCNALSGDPSGEIDITAGGGTPLANGEYTYNWEASAGGALGSPATSEDQTGLSAGTYAVTVYDAEGCIATESWTLGEPDQVSCAIASTDILCNGDLSTITVTPAGGSGPYSYTLTGNTAGTTIDAAGNPIPSTSVSAGPQDDPNNTFQVEAGTYTVEVEDDNGCLSTCTITIDQPTQLVAGTCVVQDECQLNAGEIRVCADQGVGPYTISWDSPTGGTLTPPGGTAATTGSVNDVVDCVTFTEAQGGETYVFTVTDANGCIVP